VSGGGVADFNEDSLDDLYGGDMQDATGEKSGGMTALDELEMKHDQRVAKPLLSCFRAFVPTR